MNREELLKVAKPILFSTERVRGILDKRKTMTRRVVKPQPPENSVYIGICTDTTGNKEKTGKVMWEKDINRGMFYHIVKPPYGVGDILYVRETWQSFAGRYYYRADMENPTGHYKTIWRPSIHMPKEAARIFLKVNDVRVERLDDITEEQAIKEGFVCACDTCKCQNWFSECDSCPNDTDPVTSFLCHWADYNRRNKNNKDTNPWVWVYKFEMLEV